MRIYNFGVVGGVPIFNEAVTYGQIMQENIKFIIKASEMYSETKLLVICPMPS